MFNKLLLGPCVWRFAAVKSLPAAPFVYKSGRHIGTTGMTCLQNTVNTMISHSHYVVGTIYEFSRNEMKSSTARWLCVVRLCIRITILIGKYRRRSGVKWWRVKSCLVHTWSKSLFPQNISDQVNVPIDTDTRVRIRRHRWIRNS